MALLSVQRHKAAIRRRELSRPVRLALEHKLLNSSTSFFDYGCGYGDDVRQVSELGIPASGWDPIHEPANKPRQADIVNLGYVVNVIEDLAERSTVLRDAWSLTKKLLIVSARLTLELKNSLSHSSFADGYVTSRGTFQKFYEHHELRDWINEVLDVRSVAAAPGIFFVFQDDDLLQSFSASRYRRTTVGPVQRNSHLVFEQNRDLFEELIAFVVNRGRLPEYSEIEAAGAIKAKVGSLRRAFVIIRSVTGTDQWDRIREERSQDLLVYLALSRFGRRPRISDLPFDLQIDVRAFFSTYRHACDLADDLLFSAGKPEIINEACLKSPVGKCTPDALYVHRSALPSLPPVLRVYEGCARAYIGTVEGANIVKLSRSKAQVSYLYYPNFESDPHPPLAASLIVPLQSFHIRYQEYGDSANPFILHRKETFVAPDHPLRKKFARLTAQEERHGLYETPQLIGTRDGWKRALDEKGAYLIGHRILLRK